MNNNSTRPDVQMADFTYNLPDDRIAKFPLEKRDESKLLVYESGTVSHSQFKEIGKKLPPHSLLVFNDTKVIAARLYFNTETGATIEVLLLQPAAGEELNLSLQHTSQAVWECMIGNRRKWKTGDILKSSFEIDGLVVSVSVLLENHELNVVTLSWTGGVSLAQLLDTIGAMPLPPYLHRKAIEADKESYQTVYANNLGAVAAPTAGLHFTEPLMLDLIKQGHVESFVTLHVGAGTFLPVKVESAADHAMHAETIKVSKEFLLELYSNNRPVIAVGTTSARTLESIYWIGVEIILTGSFSGKVEQLAPYHNGFSIISRHSLQAIIEWLEERNLDHLIADTSIMIMPGYKYMILNGLITNFHQPNSTLLLLISALIGDDWKRIYEEALIKDYRFLSFGDSSLLMP